MTTLLLASTSPRRRELLEAMSVPFEIAASQVAELDALTAAHLSSADLATENARLKAAAVARSETGAHRWVLGADTVVNLDQHIYGKPASLDQAGDYLRALSGRTHEVVTGCALLGPQGEQDLFHDLTRVTFRVLTDDLIARYLTDVHVLDKAGAYALQERGEWIVDRVEGSRSNVIGLPCEALKKVLVRHGLL